MTPWMLLALQARRTPSTQDPMNDHTRPKEHPSQSKAHASIDKKRGCDAAIEEHRFDHVTGCRTARFIASPPAGYGQREQRPAKKAPEDRGESHLRRLTK